MRDQIYVTSLSATLHAFTLFVTVSCDPDAKAIVMQSEAIKWLRTIWDNE